jgi:hypothetical protein
MRILVSSLFAISLLAPVALAADAPTDAAKPATAHGSAFTPAPSGWYAEFTGGFATVDFEDPDANIAFMEDIANDILGAPGPMRYFENSAAFGLELGRRRGQWSFGLAAEHQRQRVQTYTAGTSTGALDVISLMTTIDLRLTSTFRPAKLYGFELGASAGVSFGHYSEQFALYVFPAPQFNANLSGVYHATSFSGGPHIGWRRPLYGNTWLVARGAWLFRNFDELKGQAQNRTASEILITDTSLQRLDNGETASIDASSGQYTFGLSYTFGGRR